MTFYEKFEMLCKNKGITPTGVARENGIAQSVIGMWKKRGSTPKYETLKKIADYFDVSIDELVSDEEHAESIIEHMAKKLENCGPLKEIPFEEAHKIGILDIDFNKEDDRIAYFYNRLNIDGKLIAAYFFSRHLKTEDLKKVADYVEKLAETPQYQYLNQPKCTEVTEQQNNE